MKHDDDIVMNNRCFDERGSKKNPPGGRRMKNLRRKNGLHYFKQMRLYVAAGILRKMLFHEFYDTPLAGYKKFTPQWPNCKSGTSGLTWVRT